MIRLASASRARERQFPRVRAAVPSRALDALILDAEQRQSLVCARSLGRSGKRVGTFDCQRGAPSSASRFSTVSGVLPPLDREPEMFVAAVVALAHRHGARVIIPAHDGSIEALRGRRAEVEGVARLALAPNTALELALSKSKTLGIARQLGLGVPGGVEVGTMELAEPAVREMGFPLVIKPVQSWISNGLPAVRLSATVVVETHAALEGINAIVARGESALLQPWLSGPREAITMLYADGTVWASFAQVAHRMYPPLGGSSVVRESIAPPPDIAEAAERLVRALGLEGYCEVEFRRDAKGRAMLMEINPRLSASVEIAVRAGVDFPALLYAWANDEPLWKVSHYRQGLRVRWLGGDILWLRDTLARQGLPDSLPSGRAVKTFLADCIHPAAYDYVDPSDPLPAVVGTGTMLARGLGFGFRAAMKALGEGTRSSTRRHSTTEVHR